MVQQIMPYGKRSLNANERRVLKYVMDGISPIEIGHIMALSVEVSIANMHDVQTLTVKGAIADIQSKGWEIPQEYKERYLMRGKKTDNATIELARSMFANGKTQAQICKDLNLPVTTVRTWLKDLKQVDEPDAIEIEADEDTAPDVESMTIKTASSLKELGAAISGTKETFCCNSSVVYSADTVKAVYDTYIDKATQLERCRAYKDRLINLIAIVDDEINYMSAETERLWQDYERVSGGICNG